LPSRFRVPAGYVLGILVLVLAHPRALSVALGFPIAAVGEALRIWASGHIDKTRSLATGGPYAHTRNPLYLGSVLMAVGIAVASASVAVVVAVAAYLAAFYPAVIREEGAFLASKFPLEHEQWRKVVPVFFPRLSPAGPRGTRFRWSMVAANREWRTALALPLAALILFFRRLVVH
jgi:protein-S-isoprenylcysteine O-methyltransferase Ste14